MRKRLGQYFLTNKPAITRIITALDLQKNDMLIEIGPGEGALTIPLAEKCGKIGCKIIAIEKDLNLAKKIKTGNEKLEIVTGDALKVLPLIVIDLRNQSVKIVGNIPYYITGKLLRILGDLITNYPAGDEARSKRQLPHRRRDSLKAAITNIVLTIQKEVAERIIAQPPKMNLLAAAVQIWAEPEIIDYLKPGDFSPPPEVESAIIKLEIKEEKSANKNLEKYYELIKILFKQPRKTILNNLSNGWANRQIKKGGILKILRSMDLRGDERPQNLSIEIIKKLALYE